jgi:hypothetical protein
MVSVVRVRTPVRPAGQYSGTFGLKPRENLSTRSVVDFRRSVSIRARGILAAPLDVRLLTRTLYCGAPVIVVVRSFTLKNCHSQCHLPSV